MKIIASATKTSIEPHSVAWLRATAALWGIDGDHDLDEAVRLTESVPLRVRWVDDLKMITDRAISLKTLRAGSNAMLRLTSVKSGAFIEVELNDIAVVRPDDCTIEVSRSC